MAQDADLLFVAFSLREETPDLEKAVIRLVEAANGSTGELRTAYERAWALSRSSPNDTGARQVVELVTKALHRAAEEEVARAEQLAEISPVFRGEPRSRPPVDRRQDVPRTLSERLATARGERREVIDIDRLTADLDRLRASSDTGSARPRRRG